MCFYPKLSQVHSANTFRPKVPHVRSLEQVVPTACASHTFPIVFYPGLQFMAWWNFLGSSSHLNEFKKNASEKLELGACLVHEARCLSHLNLVMKI